LPLAVIELSGVAVILVMMLHIVANAFSRTVRDVPLDNTLEITEFQYMPALALMGFVIGEAHRHHIVVDLLYGRWARRLQKGTFVAVSLVTAGLMGSFALYGLDDARHAMEIRQTGGGTSVPIWPVFFLVPITFGVLAVQHLCAALGAAPTADLDEEMVDELGETAPATGDAR